MHFTGKAKDSCTLSVKRVFLAAGAISSARIVMQSKNLYQYSLPVLSTIGFIAPIWRFDKSIQDWPKANTQPAVFLEYKVPNLSDHWVHAQLSTANELVLQKLGLLNRGNNFISKWRRKLSEHLFFANCNMHSNHGVGHSIKLNSDNRLISEYGNIDKATFAVKLAKRRLFSIA